MAVDAVEIIKYLDQYGPRSCEQLAGFFAVSARSVRSYVAKANDLLDGCACIHSRRGCGYVLSIIDGDRYAQTLQRMQRGGVASIASTILSIA